MFNDFLTTTLQVVIALNVAGLIGYFCLGSRRRPTPTPVIGRTASAQAMEIGPAPSLWNKLVQPCRRALGRERQWAITGAGQRHPNETLDASLGRLRRVLDGYGNSLA